MAVDARQVVAGFLTLSMFLMLGRMVKHDHFDSPQVTFTDFSSANKHDGTDAQQSTGRISASSSITEPWGVRSTESKPCWSKPVPKQSEGFVAFSLTMGPEYHVSQVADAVAIARYLGAALVVPDIRGRVLGEKWYFHDMYDEAAFVKGLEGVVKVVSELPSKVASRNLTTAVVVRVPSGVSEEFIRGMVEPPFRANNHYVRIAIVFSSPTSLERRGRGRNNHELETAICLGMFGGLRPKAEILQVASDVVRQLRSLDGNHGGRFVAVDLNAALLDQRICRADRKSCHSTFEIAEFLRKVGFDNSTVIYLTETWWHDGLRPLRAAFPQTFTKDDLIPPEKKAEYLSTRNADSSKAVDFAVCAQSDVFVPAAPSLFYGAVAGARIASGMTQILVPCKITGQSAQATDFISTYIADKSHVAYSCFC